MARNTQSAISKFLVIALFSLGMSFPAQALFGVPAKSAAVIIKSISKHPKALSDEKIVELSKISNKSGGTKTIGKILGQQKLPDDVLEDTYMRIAVYQSKLPRAEAEGMYSRLRGTPGFSTTLRKIVGNSEVKTSGHLNELRIADNSSIHGYKVKGIGVPFSDGMKSADTDVDVLLEKEGKVIAIEAKDYLASTKIPLDKFRADMQSLDIYRKKNPTPQVIPVFSITEMPNDEISFQLLQKAADQYGVQLIVGSPEAQIIQIKQLQQIL
jgi:hypothetical protein